MKLCHIFILILTVYTIAENYECDIPGICVNSVLVEIVHPIYSNSDCIDSCLINDQCNWCTFESDFTQCILYADCNKIDPSQCTNCLTNQKECGIDCDLSGLCLVIKFIIRIM